MSIKQQIDDLYQALEQNEKAGELDETGQEILTGLRSGSIAPAEIGLVLQGASLSSSDEILGYLRTLTDPTMDTIATTLNQINTEKYSPGDVARAVERMPMDKYREENPAAAFGLEVGGGLLMERCWGGTIWFQRQPVEKQRSAPRRSALVLRQGQEPLQGTWLAKAM